MRWASGVMRIWIEYITFVLFLFVIHFSYMNTREMTPLFFRETSSVGSLFRTLWRVICEWISARAAASRYKKLDFRQLRDNEVTNDMRAEAESVLRIPKKDLRNI